MEINSINMQMVQAEISRSPAGGGNTGSASPARRTVNTDHSASDASAPQVLSSLTSSSYIKEQIDTIMYSFPPFFPVGSPQRLDLIAGIKGVQDEIKKSPLQAAMKEKLAGQNLTDAATDKEISTALAGVQQYKQEHSPNPSPPTEQRQAVKIVSITI
jgi:hypothetical protein